MKSAALGLYVHIPFCSALCHYCDFAKSANFQKDHVERYFDFLLKQLLAWKSIQLTSKKFSSVFFGGGTPGLFAKDYEKLMALINELVIPGAEITIEANPDNVTKSNVMIWRSLGFNRLSIGVQSFSTEGLRELTRQHDRSSAFKALELAAHNFPKSNGDLIYGWQGQDLNSWRTDLEAMVSTDVNHISLYALTYEGQTPFARAERRGKRVQMSGDMLATFYETACDVLSSKGFSHEEISNWSKLGTTCDHNWIYWRGHNYVGIGAGAHGYLEDQNPIGLRYSFASDFRELLRHSSPPDQKSMTERDWVQQFGGIVDHDRNTESWKLEYVGCGLRSREGLDLEFLKTRGFVFSPSPVVRRAFGENLMTIENDALILSETQWFRETAWALEISECLKGPSDGLSDSVLK